MRAKEHNAQGIMVTDVSYGRQHEEYSSEWGHSQTPSHSLTVNHWSFCGITIGCLKSYLDLDW
jgi:hypothetical protein